MQAEGAIKDGTVATVMALFADYARHLDHHRDPGAWAELFGTDGTLVVRDREITGNDALQKFAADSVPGVHVQAVPHLAVREDGGLDATSSFVFVTVATADMRAGYYVDHLAWQGDRLVFARREIGIMARTDA
jgi:hypothetical protein